MRRLVFFLTLLAIYAPTVARGNGRFPKAQAIATIPGDEARTIVLRATFGMILSRDGGESWRWLCEQAYGAQSTWDPPFATTRDGLLWIGMPDGMRVTRDACDVTSVSAFEGEAVVDFTEAARGSRLFAATSTPGKPARIWRRRDDGGWDARGTIPGLRIDTFDVAPSTETRVYVTGVPERGDLRSRFFRSTDGGQTFAEQKPSLPVAGRVFLAAVDPKSPDRVFVRILHDAGSELAVSVDGGASFRLVLHMNGSMFGFAKSDDGGTYWAGSGDPKEGVWRSRDRGVDWEPLAKSGVFCLYADGAKLFACSNPYVPGGYAVAVSTDEGASFVPLATFASIAGAVTCDGGAGAVCEAAWPATHAAITAIATTAPTRPASEAGTLEAAADAGGAERSAPSPRACGCSAVGSRSASGWGWWLAALASIAVSARRRDGSTATQ